MKQDRLLYVEVTNIRYHPFNDYAYIEGKELTSGSMIRVKVLTESFQPMVGGVYKLVLRFNFGYYIWLYCPFVMKYDELSLSTFLRQVYNLGLTIDFRFWLAVFAIVSFIRILL